MVLTGSGARTARCTVLLDADALTFGHPYNKRLPTVLPVWKSSSRVDGVRVDAVDCSQVIPIADLVEVSMYDQRRPERVRFKCRGRFGTRRYVLRCDEATDAVLLVGALRALTNPKPGPPSRRLARSKSGAIVDESRAGVHDDLMRVPGKPLGFLAASTIEYHPARPEAHRSTVLAGQKLHSSRPPKPRELPVKVSLRHK